MEPEVIAHEIDDDAVDRAAAALAEILATRAVAGDRVGILCGNRPEFLIARRAATERELVVVPLNTTLAPPELAELVALSETGLVLAEPALVDAAPPGVEVIAIDAELRAVEPVRSPDLGATLIFTSGTTGTPKGCFRPVASENARASELISTYSITSDDVHLIACPMAHSAPGIFSRTCRKAGAKTIMLSRFRPEPFLAAIERHRATLFFAVPTQIDRLLGLPAEVRARYDLSSIRAAIVAGAPFPPARKRTAVDWLGEGVLWEFYGSSETGTVAAMPPDELLSRPRSVGKPPCGVEVRVLRTDETDCDAGEIGEIFVRSRTLMSHYVNAADPFRDGFLSVGDMGHLDAGGYLTLVDRKHDTIITGGVNVYPAEVERALAEHPHVRAAIAFGVEDEQWGQMVAAVVAGPTDAESLAAFLRERIAAFKIPKAFAFADAGDLPFTSSGKPNRRLARRQFSSRLARLG